MSEREGEFRNTGVVHAPQAIEISVRLVNIKVSVNQRAEGLFAWFLKAALQCDRKGRLYCFYQAQQFSNLVGASRWPKYYSD